MFRLHPRLRQFLLGVAAGLTAQGLRALWRWVREPALGAPPLGAPPLGASPLGAPPDDPAGA